MAEEWSLAEDKDLSETSLLDEDDLSRWELVSDFPLIPPGDRSPGDSYALVGDEQLGNELAEDLVMGCLDPSCDGQFGPEERERQRCACCRFLFCERHLERWPLHSAPVQPRRASSPGARASVSSKLGGLRPRVSSCPSPRVSERSGALADAAMGGLAMTLSGTVLLCSECCRLLGPSTTSSLVESEPSADPEVEVPERRPIDVQSIRSEIQELTSQTFTELLRTPTAEGIISRSLARRLLLRLLARLRSCLRPWTDAERDWIWSMKDDLVEAEFGWISQLCRQTRWDQCMEAEAIGSLVERSQTRKRLESREAVQVLGCLGRNAAAAAASLGERRLALVATRATEAMASLHEVELACCLELLLDAGEALGLAGATGGRRAIVGSLLKAAHGGNAAAAVLRGELFWSLEARSKAASAAADPDSGQMSASSMWLPVAQEELLMALPAEAELGLLRQRTWVRHLENGSMDAVRMEPGPWGEARAFPVAVWPPELLCSGLQGQPRGQASKCAPVMVRCRCRDANASSDLAMACSPRPAARRSAGLLLKRDAGMHREQQVGQTLRLLERLVWDDESLKDILAQSGLEADDVRTTYVIAMTGPGTAIVEAVEGARTLKEVRETGRARSRGSTPTLFDFLRQHNSSSDLGHALARLACTSAISAVLSFVAGLGDRHHENFMLTTDGRLLHVDYGYALGREPFDAALIHYAVQGGTPVAVLQYEELCESLGANLLRRVFWPTARAAFLAIRRHSGLLAELVYTADVRDVRWGGKQRNSGGAVERSWASAQRFVARRCAMVLSDASAERFVHALLWYCARNERGAQLRDQLKGLRLRERTQMGFCKAINAAIATGRATTTAVGVAAGTTGVKAFWSRCSETRGTAAGLVSGVKDLLKESMSDR